MFGSVLLAWSHRWGLFRAIWFHAKASLNYSFLGYLGNSSSIWLLCSFQKCPSAVWLLFWDWIWHEHPFPALLRGPHTPAHSHPICPRAPFPKLPGKQGHGKERGGNVFFFFLSTPTLLMSELCPMVNSWVHLNWFQASASCFSNKSAEINAQLSFSVTAKH